MKKINKLTISNFKAFPIKEIFELNGKNLLVYGENGSGKSSIYWAIYTFLQSSIKSDSEIKKYFNPTHKDSLINIFSDSKIESFIEFNVIDTEDKKEEIYRISNNKINTNTRDEIKELNQASDFINYKILMDFHNFKHSENINIFSIFKKDIFPYFQTSNNEPFSDLLKEIEKKLEKVKKNKIDRFPAKNSILYIEYENKIKYFNNEFDTLILKIVESIEVFLNKYFNDDKIKFKINIQYDQKFQYNLNNDHNLTEPCVSLTAEYNKNGTYQPIEKPQSFFNEARLTAIALSIRFSLLKIKLSISDFKILVLDDMLLSLDMSNRMRVIDIILKEFSDYQIILTTHDKGFFDEIKRNIHKDDWKHLEIYSDHNSNNPIVKDSNDHMKKAKQYYDSKDYEACSTYLRKEAEEILKKLLKKQNSNEHIELENLINEAKKEVEFSFEIKNIRSLFDRNFTSDDIKKLYNLEKEQDIELKKRLEKLRNDTFSMLLKQYEHQQNDVTKNKLKKLDNLKSLKDRVLNPASHSISTPLYDKEINDAIKLIEDIKKVFK